MPHNTPLKSHLNHHHFWLDCGLLSVCFITAHFFPLFKIVPLIATLELINFFSFHLFAKHHSLKLQGFLGGFISSTAVFLQMLNDKRFAQIGDHALCSALLLAMVAMLAECALILFYFSSSLPLVLYLPIVLLALFFTMGIIILNAKKHQPRHQHTDIMLDIDHPILWKNVLAFSVIIFVIVSVMHQIGSSAWISREISTWLISLFEAHAILAATLAIWVNMPAEIDLLPLILIILSGNICSKSYLIYMGNNLKHKAQLIAFLALSFLAATALTWLFQSAI